MSFVELDCLQMIVSISWTGDIAYAIATNLSEIGDVEILFNLLEIGGLGLKKESVSFHCFQFFWFGRVVLLWGWKSVEAVELFWGVGWRTEQQEITNWLYWFLLRYKDLFRIIRIKWKQDGKQKTLRLSTTLRRNCERKIWWACLIAVLHSLFVTTCSPHFQPNGRSLSHNRMKRCGNSGFVEGGYLGASMCLSRDLSRSFCSGLESRG